MLQGRVFSQGQDLALGLLEPHPTDLLPSVQLVQGPLQILAVLQQISTRTQLGVTADSLRGHSIPSSPAWQETPFTEVKG